MDLLQEYLNQQPWRGWDKYLKHLPLAPHQRLLDLGCSVGCVSHKLAEHAAFVTGVDNNEEFVRYCLAFQRDNQTFICADMVQLDWQTLGQVDGVWCSFTLAYLTDPAAFIAELYQHLSPGGWFACLDVACFISGNLPQDSLYYSVIRNFELQSHSSGLYDFNVGAKLSALIEAAGFKLLYRDDNVDDQELNFDGPASTEVLLNWQARMQRMQALQQKLNLHYVTLSQELMAHLRAKAHSKRNNVRFVVAQKPAL